MNTVSRPAAFYIADDRALDLLNSIAKPNDTEFDWLTTGEDLLNWLLQAKLVNTTDVEHYKKTPALKAAESMVIKVRELREWFREFIIQHAGSKLATSTLQQLKPLNEILTNGNNYTQIELLSESARGKTKQHIANFKFNKLTHWQNADQLLIIIAETLANFICNADFKLIKNCEGPSCTLWFYDVSKNHSRRWCTMSICGNRAKAALHRAKKKSLSQSS